MKKHIKRLWLLIKPQRISQLSLKGFEPKAYQKLIKILDPLWQFFGANLRYIFKKFKKLGFALFGFINWIGKTWIWSKEFIIKKLIWSRGKLGRPIANIIVLGVAFVVFTFGEVLNSTRFVNSQEINPDYLSNVTDIIPNTNTALTLVPEDRKNTEAFAYTITSGDTLSTIGEQFKISTSALKYVNSLTDNSVLTVGDVLTIPPVSGLIHEVADGDTLDAIAEKYDVAPQAVADFNYILDTSSLAVGSELVIPGAAVPDVYVPPVPAIAWQPGFSSVPNLGDGFIWPTTARIITQYFAWYHDGLDIAVPWGLPMPPMFASSAGTVTRAGWDPWGLGLHVRIDHGNGFETIYGHMSRLDVGYGQQVSKGQVLGSMGNTGRSTGPHVHFILKYNGVPQDPLNYVN